MARTGSESFGRLERQIAEISEFLWERGWAECNAGNLSLDITSHAGELNLPEAGKRSAKLEYTYPSLSGRWILITISGRRFRDCARDVEANTLILRISDPGDSYEMWGSDEDATDRPTSELLVHLRIHEQLRSRKSPHIAVLHTHPTHLIAFSHMADYNTSEKFNAALWAMHPEVKVIVPRGVKLIPYTTPGSEALARATAGAFGEGNAVVVWQYHGAVAVAPSVDRAFDLVHTVDKAAQMVLLCRSAGSLPTGIGKPELDELVRIWNLEE